jgi:hypothetical protein
MSKNVNLQIRVLLLFHAQIATQLQEFVSLAKERYAPHVQNLFAINESTE